MRPDTLRTSAPSIRGVRRLRDLSSSEGDVGDAVEILRGVDDATVAEDEIESHGSFFKVLGVDAQAALAVEQVDRLERR